MTAHVPKRSGLVIAMAVVGVIVGAGALYLAGTTVYGAMSYRAEVVEAQAERARAAVERAADAVETYRGSSGQCPTIGQDLVSRELLDEPPMDPWGRYIAIDCAADHISVVSPGADGRFGTDDDVRARR